MNKNRKIVFLYALSSIVFIILFLPLSPVILTSEHCCDQEQTNLVVLTFDDGYSSWVTTIMPALARYDLTATAFINEPDDNSAFTWDDVHLLDDAGWEIGWHTARHINVTRVDNAALISDFDTCRTLFQDHGLPVPVSFAYPWGAHDEASMKTVSEYFDEARTIHAGMNSPSDIRGEPCLLDSFKLKRGLPFIEKIINEHVGQGVLIVFSGHIVGYTDEPSLGETELTVEEFEHLAEFLHENEAAGKIEVVTLKEGVQIAKQREENVRWILTLDSPFDSWDKFLGIPVPDRYIEVYDFLFQRNLRHYFPQVVNSFVPYLVVSLFIGVIGITAFLDITAIISRYRQKRYHHKKGIL